MVFEDRVDGAAAYLDVFSLVEVGSDGFMAPSLLPSELDYSLNCGCGEAVDGVRPSGFGE